MLEAVADGLLVLDEGGEIVFANHQAEALLDYPRGELIGQPFEQRLCERHRPVIGAEQRRLEGSRQRLALGAIAPVSVLRRGGGEVPVDIGLSSLTRPEGALWVVVLRDVSSRLVAEQRLRQISEQAKVIIDEAPIAKAVGDPEGRMLHVNRALCELVGYSASELTSRSFKDITHPDDLGADLELVGKLRRGEIARYQREKRYIRKDGSVVRVSIWVSMVRDEAGAPLYFVAQIEDLTERWRASEALKQSEFRYRALIDLAPVGVFVADLDGRYTEINACAGTMLGYEPGELLGKTIADLIPPADLPKLAEAREHLLSPGATHLDEWVLRHKEGRWVPVQVNASILPDGRWQAFVNDVSARKHAEQALRESEERLRRAQRVAHLGSWEWDVRTREATRSPELYLLFGLEPTDEHPPAFSLTRQIPEGERQAVVDRINAATERGEAYSVEHRLIRPDGDERVFLQQGQPVLEDGRLVRFTGTVLDVTELRRAQRAREEALAELRAVLEECPVGINIVRDEGWSFSPNAMARNMHGPQVTPTGGLAQLVGKIKSTDGAALRYEELPAVVALVERRPSRRELVLEPGDGRVIPVEISAAPVSSPDGRVSSVVVVLRDISHIKELERLRSEWNSIIAHDLRQPLNNITIFAQLLSRQPVDWTPQAREAIAQIRQMTVRLSRMTFDLLDLSRLDAGRLSLQRKPIDLVQLARECAERASLEATDRPIEVSAEGALPLVDGDADRLSQVLENLLTNALKYGAAGTGIEVAIGREGEMVKAAVTNRGRGIPADELTLVFERFARSSVSKAKGITGIGLGLPIARGLIEAHGGRIGVESVPGEKTTFWFTLPALPAPPG